MNESRQKTSIKLISMGVTNYPFRLINSGHFLIRRLKAFNVRKKKKLR